MSRGMRAERVAPVSHANSVDVMRNCTRPPLLTISEVAAFLSVSPKTVRRLTGRGLPCVRIGRVVRFRQADLLRFVEARKE